MATIESYSDTMLIKYLKWAYSFLDKDDIQTVFKSWEITKSINETLEFIHPSDIDEEWKESLCTECHTGLDP